MRIDRFFHHNGQRILRILLFTVTTAFITKLFLKFKDQNKELKFTYERISNLLEIIRNSTINNAFFESYSNFTRNYNSYFFNSVSILDDMFKQDTEHDIETIFVNDRLIDTFKLKMKHPVIIIPGFASSCLDIIESPTNSNRSLWGGINAISHLIADKKSFIEHLLVNREEIHEESSKEENENSNKIRKEYYTQQQSQSTLFQGVIDEVDLKIKERMKAKGFETVNSKKNKKIKIRANTSIESISHLLPSYWVWHKLLINLQAIGYDNNSLSICPYDWRLSFYELEKRDKFFTRLQNTIELMRKIHKKKVVLIAHSMGGLIAQQLIKKIDLDLKKVKRKKEIKEKEYSRRRKNGKSNLFEKIENSFDVFTSRLQEQILEKIKKLPFFQKIAKQRIIEEILSFLNYLKLVHKKIKAIFFDQKDQNWTETHIKSIINIGTPFLGVPSALSAFISGDWGLHFQTHIFKDFMFTSEERKVLLRDWRSTRAVFPVDKKDFLWSGFLRHFYGKNDEIVKINELQAKNQQDNQRKSTVELNSENRKKLSEQTKSNQKATKKSNNEVFQGNRKERIPLVQMSDGTQIFSSDVPYLFEIFDKENQTKNMENELHLQNPLEFPLPDAPNLTIYSFYGWEIETDCGYFHKRKRCLSSEENEKTKFNSTTRNDWFKRNNWTIDRSKNNDLYRDGVIPTDGDGTVTLLSTAYVPFVLWRKECCLKCSRPFKKPSQNHEEKVSSNFFNPSNTRTVIREYKHEPISFWLDFRGGTTSAGHVNILGNVELVLDVLKIASGHDVEERIESGLNDIVEEIGTCDCSN